MNNEEDPDLRVCHTRLAVSDDSSHSGHGNSSEPESDDASVATTLPFTDCSLMDLVENPEEDSEDEPPGNEEDEPPVIEEKQPPVLEEEQLPVIEEEQAAAADRPVAVTTSPKDADHDAPTSPMDGLMEQLMGLSEKLITPASDEVKHGNSSLTTAAPPSATPTHSPPQSKVTTENGIDSDGDSDFAEYVTTIPAKGRDPDRINDRATPPTATGTAKTNRKNPVKKGKPSGAEAVSARSAKLAQESTRGAKRAAAGAAKMKKNGKQPIAKRSRVDDDEFEDSDDFEDDPDFEPSPLTRRKRTVKAAKARAPSSCVPQPTGFVQTSLRFLLESSNFRLNLPRPSIRDARTFGTNIAEPLNTELVPSRWPPYVLHLADNFNPEDIRVPGSPPYREQCYCSSIGDCRYETCVNAKSDVYCDESCCPFKGMCGNGTGTNPRVQLMRVRNTQVFTLQARQHIDAGVELGEYLGVLSLVSSQKRDRKRNEGFRLHFHQDRDVWKDQCLCVDANVGGSLMRFLNHSCTPTAVFREVANRGGRTMVVTTKRDIFAGEEITVDYGDDLWFDCLCAVCAKQKRKTAHIK